jgi:hypothetical protein
VYVVQSYWACFGLYPSSCMWKTKNTTTFRRLDLSPSSGGWGRINLHWLWLALSNGHNWVGLSCPIHLRTETHPVSETLWDFLSSIYKTMDKVQNKPNSSVQHTQSSESFQDQKLVIKLSDAKNTSYQHTEVATYMTLFEVIIVKYNLCLVLVNEIQNHY